MNATLDTIHSLRTNHGRFSDRVVSEDDLAVILEAATRAANSSARQAYSVVVLDDGDRMAELIGYRASHALVFCVDFHRLERLAVRLGRDFDDNNIIGFVTAAVDTSLAAQTAVIAARSLGIDSLFNNGLRQNTAEAVHRELGLPRTSVFPLITVMLGYPLDDEHAPRGRLPLDVVAHRGVYRELDDAALDGLIAAYDDPTQRLGIAGLWDPQVHAHYLDWFFEEWSGKPPADRVPDGRVKQIQDWLVASGFWWPAR